MAEVNTDKGGDKGGKAKQKKQTLRVDFTPMVDMNMLLITFFMFCTSLSKPQTMEINMPSKDADKTEIENTDKIKASTAVTVILGADDKVFYYLGLPDQTKYDDPNFVVQTSYSGFQKILLEKNAGINREIKDLKVKLNNKEITEEEFKKMASDIRRETGKSAQQKQAPVVRIMPTAESTYKNLVDALDEMQICNIAAYAIVPLGDGDNYLMFTRTGNPIYKTELKTAKK